ALALTVKPPGGRIVGEQSGLTANPGDRANALSQQMALIVKAAGVVAPGRRLEPQVHAPAAAGLDPPMRAIPAHQDSRRQRVDAVALVDGEHEANRLVVALRQVDDLAG